MADRDRIAAFRPRRRQAPVRECCGGCGRRKRSWNPVWTCGRCLGSPLERARDPETSLRAYRKRVIERRPADAA